MRGFSTDYSENVGSGISGSPISEPAAVITDQVAAEAAERGARFAEAIEANRISDFEKKGDARKGEKADQMVHVSTFCTIGDKIYMTYYANTKASKEDPLNQTARLVYCHRSNPQDKVYLDIQTVGDDLYGKHIYALYDTILAKKDDDTLYVMWTAKADDQYYRLCRSFSVQSGELGPVEVNRFRVGEITNDFSTSGIQNAMTENGLPYKTMYSDIGIMQKFTQRQEQGKVYYYTGAYSGDFNCIIKTCDFLTWEYVSQPDFDNESKWENAAYVYGDKCYYFVRQQDEVPYGLWTAYDLIRKKWEKPVLIADCQSRSDFIVYAGNLYLVHAPVDREHIGIVKVNTDDIAASTPVLQADMKSSCFYPFVQYLDKNAIGMSYTVDRKSIRLSWFDPQKFL